MSVCGLDECLAQLIVTKSSLVYLLLASRPSEAKGPLHPIARSGGREETRAPPRGLLVFPWCTLEACDSPADGAVARIVSAEAEAAMIDPGELIERQRGVGSMELSAGLRDVPSATSFANVHNFDDDAAVRVRPPVVLCFYIVLSTRTRVRALRLL